MFQLIQVVDVKLIVIIDIQRQAIYLYQRTAVGEPASGRYIVFKRIAYQGTDFECIAVGFESVDNQELVVILGMFGVRYRAARANVMMIAFCLTSQMFLFIN